MYSDATDLRTFQPSHLLPLALLPGRLALPLLLELLPHLLLLGLRLDVDLHAIHRDGFPSLAGARRCAWLCARAT